MMTLIRKRGVDTKSSEIDKVVVVDEIDAELKKLINSIKAIPDVHYNHIVDTFSTFFRKIESKYGLLYLLSTIIWIQKRIEQDEGDKLNDSLKSNLNTYLNSWLIYSLTYFYKTISEQGGGWSTELYKLIAVAKKGESRLNISDITSLQDFYTFWHLALYDKVEEGLVGQNRPTFKEEACSEEQTQKFKVSVGEKELCIWPERYHMFIPIVLAFQKFMYSNDHINVDISSLPFNQELWSKVKGDFYMAYKLVELWQKYVQGEDIIGEIDKVISDPEELTRLESQANLVPFWGLKLKLLQQQLDKIYDNKRKRNYIEQQIEDLYRKISVTLVSYFELKNLNANNWYIRILSKIWDKSPEDVLHDIEMGYDNFVTKFVMEPRKKLTPPKLIGDLEKMIGPVGVIVWYPVQSNVVAYGAEAYYKDLLDQTSLKGLMEDLKRGPGKRKMITQVGEFLLPYGSFARLTNFGISEGDVALILIIRGGRNLPPFNEDLLDVVAKAIKKEGFNLRALLDFFVIYEAGETKEHLEKVAKVYEAILDFIDESDKNYERFDSISEVVRDIVKKLITAFGKKSSLSKSNSNGFSMESRYHDIGKIGNKPGLPGYYINLPRKLEPEEKEIVELHAILGAGLLRKSGDYTNKGNMLKELWNASMIALLHHSLSKGYPFDINITAERFEQQKQDRTKQIDQIKQKYSFDYFDYALDFLQSLSFEEFTNWINENKAKILAITIADIYDALREDRPYRPGFNPQEAIKILRKELDSLNDPKHPFYEIWKNIEPKLTPQFLEEARKGLI